MQWKSDYNWEKLHEDLENEKYAGVYGGPNSVYFGMAGIRAGVNMKEFHKHRTPDEFYNPDIDWYLNQPSTRRRWNDVVTLDPLGMYAGRPTMASTTAHMNMPELTDLKRDGVVIRKEDGAINVLKVAVDYAWNIPRLGERINIPEDQLREALADYTCVDKVRDPEVKVFLPPTQGCTVYFIGDVKKLAEPSTEVAVRVHDQCCGSDVFCTDICTCRPYLVFALRAAVECAQRGGVGVIVYYYKEGRSLGEVTKYRVYNARKRQDGGDRAEKYFYQTESIAGIRDARFQEMMPDVLLWLGLTRIDWLLSMSSEKYDAISSCGIEVMQRVSLPDSYVPMNAHVEIDAKISAGYHSETIESEAVIRKLRNLEMIRERCQKVYELAKKNETSFFELDLNQLQPTLDFVMDVMNKNYPNGNVPYHSRWRHFLPGSIEEMEAGWYCDKFEKARRKLDMVTVSVLLDAGAGAQWKYMDKTGGVHRRSEGIAIASVEMFNSGLFSSDVALPHRVNSHGLRQVTLQDIERSFEVSEHNNPMVGVEGRYLLLARLADALDASPEFFGHEVPRPGYLLDYVLANAQDNKCSIKVLWRAIIEGLETVWPDSLTGLRRGDIWVYNKLLQVGAVGSDMVPFHKLSQWLTLSLLEPMEEVGITFTDMHLLTGLAEYRNGGLFVDMGVLNFRDPEFASYTFAVGAEIIVEWRALTVCLLDEMHKIVLEKLNKTAEEFPLTKLLQGGTWAAGRVVAKEKRPETGNPPINIRSDGNVF